MQILLIPLTSTIPVFSVSKAKGFCSWYNWQTDFHDRIYQAKSFHKQKNYTLIAVVKITYILLNPEIMQNILYLYANSFKFS